MELGDAQCRRHGIAVDRGNAAAGKDGQAVSRTLDKTRQMLQVVLDRRAGGTAVRQDARNAAIGECVDGVELSLGRELIKRHVEGDVDGFTLAFLGRAARGHHEGAQRKLVECPSASAGLAAAKGQAVNAGAHGKAQVHLHHTQLVLVVVKVAATRANHAHHPCIVLVGIVGRSADNAGRRRGATNGKVIAQLDALCTGIDSCRHPLKVLGTKLIQHR